MVAFSLALVTVCTYHMHCCVCCDAGLLGFIFSNKHMNNSYSGRYVVKYVKTMIHDEIDNILMCMGDWILLFSNYGLWDVTFLVRQLLIIASHACVGADGCAGHRMYVPHALMCLV